MATTSVRTTTKAQRLFKVVDSVMDKARLAISQKASRLSSVPNQRHTLTSTHFDLLPAELQINIFRYCTYPELLNLRSTSHAFKDIIDVNEAAISRELIYMYDFAELSKLFPPPKIPVRSNEQQGGERPAHTLKYIHFLNTLHTTCHELAWHLADKGVTPISENLFRREKKEVYYIAIQSIRASLTPQLYHVYAFIYYTHLRLDAARAALALDYSSHLLMSEPSTLLNTYFQIQREFISRLSSVDLIATDHCMTFLVNTIRLSLSPEPPHNQNDIVVTTMLRSHAALRRILEYFEADAGGTRNGGRQLRKTFMQNMQREREEAELRNPISFGGHGYKPKVKETWFMMAKEEMKKRGLAGHEPELYTFRGGPSVRLGCQMCRDG